jgi:predicted nucleotidyltransferase
MNTPQTTILTAEIILQTLRQHLPQLQQKYKIKKLGLFGSYSRNQATEHSDIDLLIQLDPDITFGLITFCHIENTLSETLGKNVDLVIEDDLKPSLRQNILNDVIYL